MTKKPSPYFILIPFFTFIILGLPVGLTGLVWPTIRDGFGLGQDALGLLLVAGTAGSMLAGLNNGRLLTTWGMGTILVVSAVVDALGYAGYAIAPAWWVIVTLGLLTGAGSGLVDSAINTYVAEHHSKRTMNWLHACFGLGATLGPLLMQLLLAWGQNWRMAYVVVGGAKLVVVVLLWRTRQMWRLTAVASNQANQPQTSGRDVLRLPLVWLGIGIFFFYGGLEVVPANWGYTYFTEARGVDLVLAGWWAGLFWGVFTVGRVGLGAIVDWVGPVRLLRICLGVALVGAVLMWQPWVNTLSMVGMVLIGGALAPIFPTLVSLTPERVGEARAAHVIGYQVGAAGIGIALLPALAGVLAERISLWTITPMVIVLAVVVLVLHEGLLRRAAVVAGVQPLGQQAQLVEADGLE